jgi:hypothetical protein
MVMYSVKPPGPPHKSKNVKGDSRSGAINEKILSRFAKRRVLIRIVIKEETKIDVDVVYYRV